MLNLFNRFDFNNPHFSSQVWGAMLGIWLLLIACVISSILQRPFRRRTRIFWILTVICLPLIGVLLYLPFALKDDIYPYLGFWHRPKN